MNPSPNLLPFADLISPDVMVDTQVIIDCLMSGRPIPEDVVTRVRAASARIREEVFQKHGLLDIGVPAIRELRDS